MEASRSAIRNDLEKLMTSVHEDSVWLRAGHSRLQAEVTAGDAGKDHISQGLACFIPLKARRKKKKLSMR